MNGNCCTVLLDNMLIAILMAGAAIVNAGEESPAFIDSNPIRLYPYQASIERNGSHICGGAIIGSRHIATAAQCFEVLNKSEYSVRVGTSRTGTSGMVSPVKQLQIHPNYQGTGTIQWDVAVLVLEDELFLQATTKVLSIVPENAVPKQGQVLMLSGWGCTPGVGSCERLEVLQGVSVPALNRKRCATEYASWEINDSMLCAGGFIVGDLGGPLVNEQHELVGIMSWMQKNSPGDKPAIYANIAEKAIRDFIFHTLARSHKLPEATIPRAASEKDCTT